MNRNLTPRWLAVSLVACCAVGGCGKAPAALEEPPPPEVQVAAPVVREVVDYEEFTGRTDAQTNVEIRARVTGYLQEVCFKDGDTVEKGKLLFKIDPRPYQSDLAKNEAAVAQGEARLARLDLDFGRARNMLQTRAMSREDYDKTAGDRSEAKAQLDSAKAALVSSRLYLTWTKVFAPSSGRLGRRLIDPGNLVTADQTALTTLVSLDPMYVYFDVDERTLLRSRTQAQSALSYSPGGPIKRRVDMGLAYEEGYSIQGELNFQDNKVDASTGTIRMRGVFANPKTASGELLLSPGLFTRIRLPIGQPKTAVLVADRALSADQGRKFLYVIKDRIDAESRKLQQVVERRYVHPGGLHGGLREIQQAIDGKELPANEKLEPSEKVVVSGLQRIRPGAEVTPKDVPMPAQRPATTPRFLPAPANKPLAEKPAAVKMAGR